MQKAKMHGGEMKIMKLWKDQAARCWMSDNVNDSETLRLFGTTKLPTAFTLEANAALVMAEMQRLNPDHSIAVV